MRLKISRAIPAFCLVLFCAFSSGTGLEDKWALSPACGQPKSEAEVRALLLKWRDQIRPGLPAKEVKLVESEAAGLPVDLPADRLGATFEDSETKTDIQVGIKAQRRDMAYALAGYGYTFLGGNFAGQDKMKDIGFWCFLEAALLKMTSDHLLNVGFHLNERGAFDEALIVLCYAAAQSPAFPAVRNNLAYSLAAEGNLKEAVDQAAQAFNLAPNNDSYRRRLKYYGQMAGVKVDGLMAKAEAQPSKQLPYSSAFFDLFGLHIQASANYRLDYIINQLMSMDSKYISNEPGSVKSADYDRQIALAEQRDLCVNASRKSGKSDCPCQLAYARKAYASAMDFYVACVYAYHPWMDAALKANDLIFEGLGQELEKRQKRLWRGEFEYLAAILDDAYFKEVTLIEDRQILLDGLYKELGLYWQGLQNAFRACRAKPSADDPGPPQHFDTRRYPRRLRKARDGDKPWVIWFYFGDIKLNPDGTARLTVGLTEMASLKLRYNFKTKDYGAGVGLGLNVSKYLGPTAKKVFDQFFKFELLASVSSNKGLAFGAETGMKTKTFGPISRVDPAVVLEN